MRGVSTLTMIIMHITPGCTKHTQYAKAGGSVGMPPQQKVLEIDTNSKWLDLVTFRSLKLLGWTFAMKASILQLQTFC